MSRLLSWPSSTATGFLANFLALWASFVFTPSLSDDFCSLARALLSWKTAEIGSFFSRDSSTSFRWGRSFHSSRPSLSSSDSWKSGSVISSTALLLLKLPGWRLFWLSASLLAAPIALARLSLEAAVGPPKKCLSKQIFLFLILNLTTSQLLGFVKEIRSFLLLHKSSKKLRIFSF